MNTSTFSTIFFAVCALCVVLLSAFPIFSQELSFGYDIHVKDGTSPVHFPIASEEEIQSMISHSRKKNISNGHKLQGIASWYGTKFQGRETANGEIFDTYELTAAHKTLPFGTIVRVINQENEKETTVRINDRGPFVEDRVIDLSLAAATTLGFAQNGIAQVAIEIVSSPPEEKFVTLQISAFSDKENAFALQKELANNNISTDILESSDKTIFRVSISKLPKENLEQTINSLAAIGYSSPLTKPFVE